MKTDPIESAIAIAQWAEIGLLAIVFGVLIHMMYGEE